MGPRGWASLGAPFPSRLPSRSQVVPGHVLVLPEKQQDLLGVEEEGSAGEAAEKQYERDPLQDDSHVLLVGAAKDLQNSTPFAQHLPHLSSELNQCVSLLAALVL